jgi:hypothetical protein
MRGLLYFECDACDAVQVDAAFGAMVADTAGTYPSILRLATADQAANARENRACAIM